MNYQIWQKFGLDLNTFKSKRMEGELIFYTNNNGLAESSYGIQVGKMDLPLNHFSSI